MSNFLLSNVLLEPWTPLCHLNCTQTNLHTNLLGISCGSRNCDRTHTHTTHRIWFNALILASSKCFQKEEEEEKPFETCMASKNVVWPHTTEPRARKHRRTTKRHFWWPYRKGTSPNESYTYTHIRSRESKNATHSHMYGIYKRIKERRGTLRKQEENMKKLLLEL